MSTDLPQKIVELAERAGARGLSMGEIVDRLVADGYADEIVEETIWVLLEARLLTPVGYVQRMLRRRDETGAWQRRRSYEFMLVPWSPERDRQDEPRP